MSLRDQLFLLPNLISLARLMAVPVTVYLLWQGAFTAAFWVFVAAGISDAVDGYLAKRLGVVSEVGAYLDPMADKALLIAVYITLGALDLVAMWLVFLIVFRDLLIIAGAILFQTLTQSLKMTPLFISKVNTAAQITLACVVLAKHGLGLSVPILTTGLVFGVAATTALSGAAYILKWGRLTVMMERER
ncbi:MAG: CDP-alcohol phosphatidyltransferase family protein [Kiloniellaceae bacterium]